MTLPVPKYKIGDVVWRGRVFQKEMTLPCPDCLNTGTWKVTTPGGSELEADCQRCRGHWQQRGVPSLKDFTFEVVVERLTIGSVRIDTADRDDHPVSYMCRETGVGSGSIHYENMLHPSEEEARAQAQAEVAAKEKVRAATPERLEKVRFKYLSMRDAALLAANDAVWNSWRRYKNLREDIEGELEGDDKAESLDDLRDKLQHHLNWDKEYRNNEEHDVFEGILQAAKVAAQVHNDTHLQGALDRLPSLQAERRKAKAEERG
jgi:hypothetical protein